MSEYTFEPYQKVLARFREGEPWTAVFYSHKGERGHLCGCYYYDDCIPYEGNEHLVGTTDDPRPKWKPKPGELVAVTDSLEETWRARRFFARNETLFLCYREKGLETEGWLFCEPLRKHFNVPEEA